MRVLYFGSYNRKHPRNQILIKGLRINGIEVIELHDRSCFLAKYIKLFLQHWPLRHRYEAMIVGFPGFIVMPLARLVATAPIVFDAFVSYYDANVFDRKLCSPKSFRAKYYYFLDWFSCKLADVVLLETNSLIDYFVKTFKLNRQKFHRVFIGANDEIFRPLSTPRILRQRRRARRQAGIRLWRTNSKFLILFWGWMTPQHGVEHILQAAKILANEAVEFMLIGGGPEKPKMMKLKDQLGLSNVVMLDPLPPKELVKYIQQADVCLGVFGDVPRLKTVVTNKVYEALACGKSLITANEGAREVLLDGVHCLFCRPADPNDLVEKILKLKEDSFLRERIAVNGRKLYEEFFSMATLGAELKSILEQL